MTDPVTVVLMGQPVAWARSRPKYRTPGEYITPAKQRSNATTLQWAARAAMVGRSPFECALRMDLSAEFQVPKSWSGKKQNKALTGEIRPTVKPDLSNVVKQVEDAFNKIIYRDDALIVEYGNMRKVYSGQPKIVVTITPIAIPLADMVRGLPNDALEIMIDEEAHTMSDPELRAVVSEDGERILLTIYGMCSSAIVAEMDLSPLQAVRLASELTRGAGMLLWNQELDRQPEGERA